MADQPLAIHACAETDTYIPSWSVIVRRISKCHYLAKLWRNLNSRPACVLIIFNIIYNHAVRVIWEDEAVSDGDDTSKIVYRTVYDLGTQLLSWFMYSLMFLPTCNIYTLNTTFVPSKIPPYTIILYPQSLSVYGSYNDYCVVSETWIN